MLEKKNCQLPTTELDSIVSEEIIEYCFIGTPLNYTQFNLNYCYKIGFEVIETSTIRS